MHQFVLGRSVEGRPIIGFSSTRRASQAACPPVARGGVLILGGFHGDEPKSVHVARKLIEFLEDDGLSARPPSPWVIVPLVNPDGYECRRRRNARGVDLNRNFPTENWAPGAARSRMFGGPRPASEPETRAVIRTVQRFLPALIITIHSIGGGRQCDNYDGPGRKIAARMSRRNGYPVTATIGYPTPGSFGTWAGIERRIPTITLELPSQHSPRQCWEDNREALLHVLRVGG